MLDNTSWYRPHNGLDRFISWLEAQRENAYEWDDCEDCLFARYARMLAVQLGQAWCSLHPDGRVATELYCQIGAGDQGGSQSYVDALARTKYWQERPMRMETLNPDMDCSVPTWLPTIRCQSKIQGLNPAGGGLGAARQAMAAPWPRWWQRGKVPPDIAAFTTAQREPWQQHHQFVMRAASGGRSTFTSSDQVGGENAQIAHAINFGGHELTVTMP
jgi:hypothetical protein